MLMSSADTKPPHDGRAYVTSDIMLPLESGQLLI